MIAVGQVYFCPFTKGIIVVTKIQGEDINTWSVDYEGTKQLGRAVSIEVFVDRFEPVHLSQLGFKQKDTLKSFLKPGQVLLNGYIEP